MSIWAALAWPSPCRAWPDPISQRVVPGQPTDCILGPSTGPSTNPRTHFVSGRPEKHEASVVPVLFRRPLAPGGPACRRRRAHQAPAPASTCCASRRRRLHRPRQPTPPRLATSAGRLRPLPARLRPPLLRVRCRPPAPAAPPCLLAADRLSPPCRRPLATARRSCWPGRHLPPPRRPCWPSLPSPRACLSPEAEAWRGGADRASEQEHRATDGWAAEGMCGVGMPRKG